MKINYSLVVIAIICSIAFSGCSTPQSSKHVMPSDLVDDSTHKYTLKYESASPELILEAYANNCGRELLLSPEVPKDIEITLKANSLSKKEMLYAIEEALRLHGIDILIDGDKFLKVVPLKQ